MKVNGKKGKNKHVATLPKYGLNKNLTTHDVLKPFGGPWMYMLCICTQYTNNLHHVKGKVSKLTKEMQAASSKILTNRSSNCSTTNSQMLFPV